MHLPHDQHAGIGRESLAHGRFRLGSQPQPTQLIIRREFEYGLQGATRHGLAGADEVHRALHAAQRQIETGGIARGAAGIERHHATLDINHRRAG